MIAWLLALLPRETRALERLPAAPRTEEPTTGESWIGFPDV